MLGQTLLDNATDRQNRSRQLADEQRKRQERLSDVRESRQYEESQFDKLRGLQLSDEQRRRFEALSDAEKRALLENRIARLKLAQDRGLITVDMLGDVAAEDAALTALANQLREEADFSRSQPGRAQEALADLGAQEQEVRARMGELESRLASQPTVDQSQIQRRAMEIATANAGGKTPSREQIAEAIPQANQEAQEQAYMRWSQDKQDAQVQYQILANQLNTIRQQQAQLTSTFRVAPSVIQRSPAPSAAPVAPSPVSSGNPMQGFLKTINQQTPPPPSVDSGVGQLTKALTMAPPEMAPAIRQARTAALADERAKLDAPLFEAQKSLADNQRNLQLVQMGVTPGQGVYMDPFAASTAMMTQADQDPRIKGQAITRLLMQNAAAVRQVSEEEKKRRQGIDALLSGLRMNTPSQTVPIVPPSPGSILSSPR